MYRNLSILLAHDFYSVSVSSVQIQYIVISDCLVNCRFKINQKLPRGPPSPPSAVMHSPTRKVTVKEQQEWKIPPCISNWKNAKGYTIPLDKRLAADGRGLQQVLTFIFLGYYSILIMKIFFSSTGAHQREIRQTGRITVHSRS